MDEKNPIRILVVDDHAVVRRGLLAFLTAFKDMEVVGESPNGEDALRLCKEAQPDVVLMDLVMPGMDGVAATASIRKSCPETQVIVLTSYGEEERIQAALKAGAIGYLLKDASAEQLVSAIRGAKSGVLSLAPDVARALMQPPEKPAQTDYNLTDCEKQVLVLMVEGLSNPEIAERLSVSISTARFHVSNILSKLRVLSRTAAVTLAIQHKLVS